MTQNANCRDKEKRLRVLVVDDSEMVRLTIVSALRPLDLEVILADSGETALLEIAKPPLPDLILLDVMMPGISGYEVLRGLKASKVTSTISVIFVTALDDSHDEELGIQLGAADYLLKPIKPAVLRARVQAQLSLSAYRQMLEDSNNELTSEVHSMSAVKAGLEKRLSKTSAYARLSGAVLAGINDGVCVTDTNNNILLINQAFSDITGYSEFEAIGQKPTLLKSGIHTPSYYQEMWRRINTDDNWQGEITNRRKDGSLVSEWLSISAIRDENNVVTNYMGIFSDLLDHKKAASRIQYLATYDPLTDLPNRNLFADRLAQSVIHASRFNKQTAVFLLDIDKLRNINDTLGAPTGDAVLVEVAKRLKPQIREGDTVGRRSGNEFGFVMADMAQEHDAVMLANRMLAAISTPMLVYGKEIRITASIGISISPRDGIEPETLLAQADIALEKAKQSGRNHFKFYSADMDASAVRRMALETALRSALEKQQMYVVYQPQISLHTGNIMGMEALLRWRHPEFGLVSPSEFIPIAEESGEIIEIGKWVLQTACRQTKTWLDLGLADLRLAVNLSTKQFRQSDLCRDIVAALETTGLPPGALELEITESAFIDDIDVAIEQSRSLKLLGVKLSLDDFGTGYSSLAYLSRFPFDKLKIDQGFVRDITENPVNAAIANAAIVLARSLNLAVLAEGVETEAQAAFLRTRRCDAMQGYLFSRPIDEEDFGRLLTSKQRLNTTTQVESRETLLIVDDEPNVVSSLQRLLRREGYKILSASTPKEAFEILARHPVQVIVSDQRLPDMQGTTFFSKVRSLYPDTIRIILTGYTDISSVIEAINQGAVFKFLSKPWGDDEFREQIRDAFRQINVSKQFSPISEQNK